MLFLLLALQAPAADTVYATPALRQFIEAAAVANRFPPAQLPGYRARLETDIALIARTGPLEERAQQLEQIASELSWRRSGNMEQRVVGYRSRAAGLTVSALTALRNPWIVPTLYGDRLRFALAGRRELDHEGLPGNLLAVHPLAADREAVYRFSGGDTVVTMHVPDRTIHLVRVAVEPRLVPHSRTLLFRGELLIDAERKHVVRMRGEFVIVQKHHSPIARLRNAAFQALLFAELVDGEIEGQFWLPTYQRVEIQIRSRMAAEFRPIFRLVTRFQDYEIDDSASAARAVAPRPGSAVVLTFAPSDTLNDFSDWSREIGVEATSVAATDFDDVAPDAWRATGSPRMDFQADHASDLLRFNKVEGLYLGPAARFSFRDAFPGLSVNGRLGWATAQRTARGGMAARWLKNGWQALGVVERKLVTTNDFIPALGGDATIGALLGTIDDFDYVDRWKASLRIARELGGARGTLVSYEVGPGRDESEITRVRRGLLHPDSLFRFNRPATEGTYLRQAVTLQYHPGVSGEFFEPGVGAAIAYERGDGALQWQRMEARLAARRTLGPFSVAARMDGAIVFGGAPAQQLIELGENEGLPGYSYKEFGGDRAALVRAGIVYQLPVLRAPLRPLKWLVLPNLSPALGASIQGGWTDASSPAARATLLSFGYRTDPVSGLAIPATRPTGGIRSTVTLSLGLFGGALGIGMARPLDQEAPWVFVIGASQTW